MIISNLVLHDQLGLAIVLLEAAVDLDGLPALGMAHVVDGDVVVRAPMVAAAAIG